MSKNFKKLLILTTSLSVLYVLLGPFSVTQIQNPFLDGGFIAFNMTLVVFAGITFGPRIGAAVGFGGAVLSTLLVLLIPNTDLNYLFDLYSIIPHTIMGYTAGVIAQRTNIFFASLSIIIGHALNMVLFIAAGLFPLAGLDTLFWRSISYETIIGIVIINIVCNLFLISFSPMQHYATAPDT